MTTAHHLAGWTLVAVTGGVLVAAIWSWLAARSSGGARDHRFAVDRLVIAALGAVALVVLLGLAVLAGGARPADPLHVVYGVAALATIPVAWGLGSRRPAGGAPSRRRRDAWLVLAAAVMLGIELRSFLTG